VRLEAKNTVLIQTPAPTFGAVLLNRIPQEEG
jgi:hypothetical protein